MRFPYVQVVAHATPPHWADVALCEVCHRAIDAGDAIYRVDKWERKYAHAVCADQRQHLNKATLLARQMFGGPEPGLALLDWPPDEQRLYVHWASSALRSLGELAVGTVEDMREFVK